MSNNRTQGRNIALNARFISHIFDYCQENDEELILLFLDFQNVIDSIEWNFMFDVLKKFNLRGNFIMWINILY